MPVIGTAGHVDHGKSTLVAALTGLDPDRWAEEKERGLTIDLGFAWTAIDELEVSFVDVPGHERYAKNMLAGIEAIDVALFVVAADEGWMPQSEEHLAVLDLLDVDRGVVALTKCDRVDDDLIELATLEVAEHLEGTSLASVPIVPISAVSRTGLDELRAALADELRELPSRVENRPRMWIDRAFSVGGAGTVVTGTLLGGPLQTGETVTVWPGRHSARIRGIQSHEKLLETAVAHQRTALNLSGIDTNQLQRGSMLGRDSEWRLTKRFASRIRTARFVEELTNRGAYHLHIGSGSWPVRLRLLDADVAMMDVPDPLPLEMGDRFVIRDTGRRLVVGGGRVIEPGPSRPQTLVARRGVSRPVDRLIESLDRGPDAKATALLELRGTAMLDELAASSGGGRPPEAVTTANGRALSVELTDEIVDRLETETAAYHEAHPLRPGMPAAESKECRQFTADEVQELAGRSLRLSVVSGIIRQTEFRTERTLDQEVAWEGARSMLERLGPDSAPRMEELGLERELLQSLIREGAVIAVGEFIYLPKHLESILSHIRSFEEPFTVSEFKERAGVSRKYAIPLMEWADSSGITVRMGDRRRVRDTS